jgi:hypothetical protein
MVLVSGSVQLLSGVGISLVLAVDGAAVAVQVAGADFMKPFRPKFTDKY